MKSAIWKYRFVIPLVLFPLLLVLLWFQNGLIHGGGDEELLFVNATRALEISSTTWLRSGTGIAILYWLSRLPFAAVIYFFNTYFLIPNVIIQASTLFLLITTGTLSVYCLTKIFTDKHRYSDWIGFVAGIFYALNPYSMSQVWGRGQYAQYFSFALLPLSLLFFTIGIRKKSYIYALLFAVISVLFSTAYGFLTFSVVQWGMLLLYVLYEAFSTRGKRKINVFPVQFFFLCLFFWILVHAWWILPMVLAGSSILGANIADATGNIGTLLGVSQSYPFPIMIRLLQSFYFFSEHGYSPYYSILRFQVISWIPVVFLAAGIFGALRIKVLARARFFLIIFIIGLLVSLGSNPPLGSAFVFIFEHVPILQMFRNPYEKAGLLYVLSYAPLFAIGVVLTFDYIVSRASMRKIVAVLLGALLILLLNIYLWPLWTGKLIVNTRGQIGLSVPQYYHDFEKWLLAENGNYRVMMTPLWSGDGSWYEWNGTLYQGVDPMTFLIGVDSVSNISGEPYNFSFAHHLRKYYQELNIRPALELLRVRYLVNKNDAIMLTPDEKGQSRYLSEVTHPLSSVDSSIQCDNSEDQVGNVVNCMLPESSRDWNDVRYITMSVRANTPSSVEASIADDENNGLTWDGRGLLDYYVGNDWATIVLPLYAPTSRNERYKRDDIQRISISAHPLRKPSDRVDKIEVKDIAVNSGEEVGIHEFAPYKQFGKLSVSSPTSLTTPPEFGVVETNKVVSSYLELFSSALKERENLDTTGFIIASQNSNKNIQSVMDESSVKIVDLKKVSETRYWLKIDGGESAYIILSKTFYPGWKLIPDTDKKMLDGDFFSNLTLLAKSSVPESEHYVVNGYANLWNVGGESSGYAAVFIPQIIAEVGRQVSSVSIVCLLILLILLKNERRIRTWLKQKRKK